MRKSIIHLAAFASCLHIAMLLKATHPVLALYDPRTLPNNKVGIHILETSEVETAASLVNTNGGDWGYVTVPIQPTDRNKEKWQAFMTKATQIHLIPILRITTMPKGGTWDEAQDTDLVDFANFLDELYWPTENRYIVLFNEVNRSQEWGDQVNPEKYARIIKNANIIFKERSNDFFLLPAGFDNALANTTTSKSTYTYLREMVAYDLNVWDYIDGWTSHAYPNPDFMASPYKTGLQSITSYRQELTLIGKQLPVFITETGWDSDRISQDTLRTYYTIAWEKWLADDQVIAVTPFVLSSQDGPFTTFSFLGKDNQPTASWQATERTTKMSGAPKKVSYEGAKPKPASFMTKLTGQPSFSPFRALIKLENIIRKILGLPTKASVAIDGTTIIVELASTNDQITKGLSGRNHLSKNAGMFFVLPRAYPATFWMRDMRFPLDLIWIRDNTIVNITENVPPETQPPFTIYRAGTVVNKVLEVNAGFAHAHGIEAGDTISFEEL